MTTVGIVSPGAMGSALGRAWRAGGARVVATVEGRSARTRDLAHGLELLPTLADVVADGRRGGQRLPARGGASGCWTTWSPRPATPARCSPTSTPSPPTPWRRSTSGPAARGSPSSTARSAAVRRVRAATRSSTSAGRTPGSLAAWPADGIRARVVGDRVGTASAVKMCTASVYKGTTAVWAQALQTAHALGVLDVVLADLAEEHPDQVATAARRIGVATSKAHRFVGEMEQIAHTQAAAGASGELFAGMAAVYRRLAATDLAALPPERAADLTDLAAVLQRLSAD